MSKPLDSDLFVSAAYRKPFASGSPKLIRFEPGITLEEMVKRFDTLPPDFDTRGEIAIGGHVVKRSRWGKVKLKPGKSATFHYALGGGGGSGAGKKSKGILTLIIGIATILTAGLALSGAFATGGLFLAGSTSAQALAAGITIAGQLLSKAISAPPKQKDDDKEAQAKGSASSSGNVLEAGAPIPRVIGTMKIYPSLLTQPFTYRSNGDEIVEAIFGLAGPHQLTSIKVGDTDIAAAEDVKFQVLEGWDYDSPIDLIQRYAVTRQPNIELSVHDYKSDDDDQVVLRNQIVPESSLPIFHGVATSNMPDQINIDLDFPEGLYKTTDSDNYQRVPFRIRIRNLDTGITYNLPEIYYSSKVTREIRPTIVLKWGDIPENVLPYPANNGWVGARTNVPPQAVSPPQGGWQADASFYSGSGNEYVDSSSAAASGVQRVNNSATDEITFTLDAAAIPRGRYQFEIKRGIAFDDKNFSDSTYQFNGNVYDFFGYITSGSQALSVIKHVNTSDRCGLVRVSNVYNTHPINGGLQGSGLAIIAVKATNRSIENLSVIASGYMKDWDGTGWTNYTTSANPATQFHDVLTGDLTPDPIDSDLIDNDSLLEWRQDCINNAYTCNMICEGDSIAEILQVISGCGYARPRMSETWGVIRDYDRSTEDPSQIFTAANSFGVTMENAFSRLPDAFRVIWTEAASDYSAGEEIVFRSGVDQTANPRLEEITYRGLTTRAAAIRRANFDLLQVALRSATFTFNAPAEAIRVTRGDLIALNHDFVDRLHDSGRVLDVEFDNDDNIVAVILDRQVPVYNEADMLDVPDMLEVDDMLLVGAQTSVSLRESTGLISTHAVSNGGGFRDRLVLTTPAPLNLDVDDLPTIRPENLAWVGAAGNEYLRLIVTGITYDKNMTAQITAVAEAPEIWASL